MLNWHVAEVNVAVGLSRAWAFADGTGDLDQWEDLCEGSGNPWEDHGPCLKKTRMEDDAFVLRVHVLEWGMADA